MKCCCVIFLSLVIIVIGVSMVSFCGGIKKLYNYVLMSLDVDPDVLILNAGYGEEREGPSTNASELAQGLQKSFLRLKGRYLTEDGKAVDYKGLRESEEFGLLFKESQNFRWIQLADLNEVERKAFYINLYNIITIHGLAISEPVKSVLELTLFWRRVAYNVGGHVMSLDLLEHGLIRGNRPHPTSKKLMISGDSDLIQYMMKTLDPRIHFALNCGAKSCPAIRVYSEQNLDAALEAAAKSFCSNEVTLDDSSNTVGLSQIFEWYGADFGNTNREILEKISTYLPDESRSKLDKILESDFKIVYNKYDWGLNILS